MVKILKQTTRYFLSKYLSGLQPGRLGLEFTHWCASGRGAKAFNDGQPVFAAYSERVLALGNGLARAGYIETMMGAGLNQAAAEGQQTRSVTLRVPPA